jgi:SAM-dependent methyltransferase
MTPAAPDPRPNAAMTDHWNGPGGERWVANAHRLDRTLGGYGHDVLDAATIGTGDRVLDVGCGTGTVTRAAAIQASRGRATGVDIGWPMVEAARAIAAAEGPANVSFLQADAQVHPFEPGSVDVIVSRFGVMFFDDPVTAFANLRTALPPGGRLAFVCWQPAQANEWATVPVATLAEHLGPPGADDPDAPGPWSLGDPDRVRSILTEAGFTDIGIEATGHEMRYGADVDEALAFIRVQGPARAMTEGRPQEQVDRALAALRRRLGDFASSAGVTLSGRAWLATARSS